MKAVIHYVFAAALLAFVVSCGLPGVTNAPPAQERHFTIKVTGKTADVTHLTAYDGDTLTITVCADKSEEIHMHGYDKHFFPAPGKPAAMSFKANLTGTFEYEIEASSTPLGNLVVNPR